jgi:hypothetical protein
MELNIKIKLDNEAYKDLGYELGRNLDWIISEIGLGSTKGKVRDYNGNTTGQWEIHREADTCPKFEPAEEHYE